MASSNSEKTENPNLDNRANQLNHHHDQFWKSRGRKKPKDPELAVKQLKAKTKKRKRN